MSKIKVCRASGLPIEVSHIEDYDKEFKQVYDKVITKLGLLENMPLTEEQSIRSNKLLTRVQKSLLKKYPVVGEWSLLASSEAWAEKVKQVGPIAVAIDSSTSEIAYIILDEGF